MKDITRIISAIELVDPQAAEQLLPLIYDELRKMATRTLAHEKPGQTLQATALIMRICKGLESQSFQRLFGRDAPLSEPGLQRLPKRGVIFEQAVDEVVILFEGNKLKGRDTVDRDNDRFLVAQAAVLAQVGLCLTQRDQFHDVQ